MIDDIKQFFQSMYDATIGKLVNWVETLYLWLSESFDLVLLVLGFGLTLVALFFVLKLLVPVKALLALVIESVVIASVVAFVVWFMSVIVDMYNQIITLSGLLNTDGNLGCFGHMLDCLSVRGILSIFFTQLFIALIIVLLLRTYVLFIWGKQSLANALDRIRFS